MEKAYMKEFAVIGKNAPITDAREKATGQAMYVDDLKFPQMLYGKILRSPHPHARILNIDTSKAEKVPGVKAVITAEDTPKKKWGAFIQDQYILAVDKVRYVGDEVAAIAA
jgi:CO/xanthine dehydrogenase Mo-binding subunit